MGAGYGGGLASRRAGLGYAAPVERVGADLRAVRGYALGNRNSPHAGVPM